MNSNSEPTAGNLTQHQPVSSGSKVWTWRILSGLLGAFFLFDAVMKLAKPVPVVAGTLQLGFAESSIIPIGMALLVCTILYLLRRTAVFGAILLTGYLGGAVASQVRIAAPWFNILFPAVFACLVWAALSLRDTRVRALMS